MTKEKLKTRLQTPWGRINFHSVIEPSAFQEGAVPEYVLELFFDMKNEKTMGKLNELEKDLFAYFREKTGEDTPDNPFIKDGNQMIQDKLKRLEKALKKEGKSADEIKETVERATENLSHLKDTKVVKAKTKYEHKLEKLTPQGPSQTAVLDREADAAEIEELFYSGAKVSAVFNIKEYEVNGNSGLSLYLNRAIFGAHAERLASNSEEIELDCGDLELDDDISDLL